MPCCGGYKIAILFIDFCSKLQTEGIIMQSFENIVLELAGRLEVMDGEKRSLIQLDLDDRSIDKAEDALFNIHFSEKNIDSTVFRLLFENNITTKKLFLEKSAVTLDVFSISAEREESKTEVRASVIKVTPKQITKIQIHSKTCFV